MLDIIKDLSCLNGTSGRENRVREYIISKLPADAEAHTDALGNLIVYKKGRQKAKSKVMLAAHMDEVGFIVTGIDSGGFIKFDTVGGIDASVLLGKAVAFDNGLRGVIGLKPVHLIGKADRNKMPKIDDMYIDIGAKDKDDASAHLSPGDTGVFESAFVSFGDHKIKGKALDDRIGCAIMLDMINSGLPCDAVFAFNTREEVGLVGAAASAFTVRPDYAIVLEATTAADIADTDENKKACLLGEGAAISFMDKATVYDPELFKKAFEIAETNSIKAQAKTVVAGGNDAGAIHKSAGGVRTLTLSVPCRYIHSPSCVADTRDIDSTRRLAEALYRELASI